MNIDQLDHEVFYGVVQMCDRCRRKNDNCTNRQCRTELIRMISETETNSERKENEQMSLF